MDIPIIEFYDDEPFIRPENMANSSHPHLNACKERLDELKIKTAVITWIDKDSASVAHILKDAELVHSVYGKI